MTPSGRWTRRRLAALAGGLLLTALPFLLVAFPPSTDLPQHVAQARLLAEHLGLRPETAPREETEVRLFAPNLLPYPLLFAAYLVLPPVLAGKATLLLLALAWVAALHVAAAARGRPPEAALLGGLFVFSAPLGWGLLGFLAGFPIFVAVLCVASRESEPLGVRGACGLAALLFLLFFAHVLWLPFAFAAVVLGGALRRGAPRDWLVRLAALAPAALAAAAATPSVLAARGDSAGTAGAHWSTPVPARLASGWLVDAFLGAVQGAAEPLLLLGVFGFATIAALDSRRATERAESGGSRFDARFLAAGALLVAWTLLGPDKYANTLAFASRFGPPAAALLLLAAPMPSGRGGLRLAAAAIAAAAFVGATASSWVRCEREEMSGLRASLDSLPRPARVLGLDFDPVSEHVKGRPFLQAFAWSQAANGGELSFSYAEHRSGVVVWKGSRDLDWTGGLEWLPERVTPRDLTFFDYAFVHATDAGHARFRAFSGARALVAQGRFRLYALRAAARAGS